jgi:hypothetical protein
MAPNTAAGSSASGGPTITSMPSGSARVCITAMFCGWQFSSTKNPRAFDFATRSAITIASAAGRGLVEQRGVGDRQPGQVRHHRLEVQQRLQPALADLGLVGRVGGVPGRVLQHVALDRGRRDRAVKALPDHLTIGLVLRATIPHMRPERSRSDIGAQSSGSACRIEAARSRRSARRGSSTPTTFSISAISAGEGPIWRRLAKSVGS